MSILAKTHFRCYNYNMVIYNNDYHDLTLRLNAGSAEKISRVRWGFVAEVKPEVVFDFGSGPGFFRAFAPPGVTVDTYDIGSVPTTGIQHAHYDLVCLWDVFEHIEDYSFLHEVLKLTDCVALSVPILPPGKNLFTWKHFKPGEHLYQFTPDSLEAIFNDWGFVKIKDGTPEVECGIREDIYSVVYGREK